MKKYFVFKGEISGGRYFLRMFLQQYLIYLFGLGLYLMVVTSYQRACALTESRSTRILFAINPLLSVLFGAPLFFMLGYEDYDTSIFFEDTLSTLLSLVFLITIFIHWYLIFKNRPS